MATDANIEVVFLDDCEHLMDATVEFLNGEWPRGRNARLRSLEHGCKEKLPVSLLLVSKSASGKESVIGHSKILPVPQTKDTCFVESVLIDKSYRGKGYGRLIMEKIEAFVKAKGVKNIYLATYDQQDFYRAIGYEFCEPVTVFSGGSVAFHEKIKAMKLPKENISGGIPETGSAKEPSSELPIASSNESKTASSVQQVSSTDNKIPPTPAPPAPAMPTKISSPGEETLVKIHMKKKI